MKDQILSEAYRPVLEEIRQRSVRSKKVKVIDYTPKSAQSTLIGHPGFVMAFVANKALGISKLVEQATKEKVAAERLKEMMEAQTKRFKKVSLQAGINMMVGSDVFAELRLGKETLVQTLFVPEGADYIFEEFIYNGGPLPKSGFEFVERVKEGSDAALECVILKINPVLSAAEKAALEKVPDIYLPQNLAAATCCGDSYTAVGVVVLAVVATLTLTCLGSVSEVKTIPKEELKALGPIASARKLLEVRQKAIMKKWPAD